MSSNNTQNYGGYSSVGRALLLRSRCQRFESAYLHHYSLIALGHFFVYVNYKTFLQNNVFITGKGFVIEKWILSFILFCNMTGCVFKSIHVHEQPSLLRQAFMFIKDN